MIEVDIVAMQEGLCSACSYQSSVRKSPAICLIPNRLHKLPTIIQDQNTNNQPPYNSRHLFSDTDSTRNSLRYLLMIPHVFMIVVRLNLVQILMRLEVFRHGWHTVWWEYFALSPSSMSHWSSEEGFHTLDWNAFGLGDPNERKDAGSRDQQGLVARGTRHSQCCQAA